MPGQHWRLLARILLTVGVVCLPALGLVGVRDILREVGAPGFIGGLVMLTIGPWIFGTLFIVPAALFFPPRPDAAPPDSDDDGGGGDGGDNFDPPGPRDDLVLTDEPDEPDEPVREHVLAGVS